MKGREEAKGQITVSDRLQEGINSVNLMDVEKWSLEIEPFSGTSGEPSGDFMGVPVTSKPLSCLHPV